MWQELDASTGRPPDRSIAITGMETMPLRGNPKGEDGNYTWGIVKLETDRGVHGIGETFRGDAPLDVAARMADTVVGMNPLDTERVADRLERTHYTASGGIGRAAIAAIETACWDIAGKVLEVPVYELLGGKYRDTVQLYSDTETLAGESVGIDHETAYEPDEYAAAAETALEMGFDAIKFDLDVATPGLDADRAARRLDNAAIEHKVALVEAAREAVGPDVDLGMDCHWSYTVETAVRLGRALEPYDLAFLEDPVHPEKLDAQRSVREAIDIPVLTGENLTGREAFLDALQAGILDIAAPDVSMCAGLGELRRIASLCDAFAVPLAPHNLGSPVATVAGAHFAAATPNVTSMEFRGGDAPWWEDVVERTDGNAPIRSGGELVVPEGPGLGIEIADAAADYVLPDGEFVF